MRRASGPGGWTTLRLRHAGDVVLRVGLLPRAGARRGVTVRLSRSRRSRVRRGSIRCRRCSPAPKPSRRGSCLTARSTSSGRCCSSRPRTTPTASCAARSTTRPGRPSPSRTRATSSSSSRGSRARSSSRASRRGRRAASRHRLRELDVHQRADLDHARRARVPVPRPQPVLLLRAQHVHGGDGHRARRLRARSRPRRRASCPEWGFIDTVADFTGVLARPVHGQRALQPVRGGAVDARGLRADDRLAARPPVRRGREGRVVAVPVPDHLRHRRDGQPLPRRRRARRAHGGAWPPTARRLAGPGAARRLGFGVAGRASAA